MGGGVALGFGSDDDDVILQGKNRLRSDGGSGGGGSYKRENEIVFSTATKKYLASLTLCRTGGHR